MISIVCFYLFSSYGMFFVLIFCIIFLVFSNVFVSSYFSLQQHSSMLAHTFCVYSVDSSFILCTLLLISILLSHSICVDTNSWFSACTKSAGICTNCTICHIVCNICVLFHYLCYCSCLAFFSLLMLSFSCVACDIVAISIT